MTCRSNGGVAPRDGGFVLFEVLVAAAILAMAGTMILLIGNDILSNRQRELDRSMALVNTDGLNRELSIVGEDNQSAVFPADDGVFRYILIPISSTSNLPDNLAAVRIEAHPKSSPEKVEYSIDALIPKHARAFAR